MRIAFLSAAAGLGGAERLLLHLLWSVRAAAPDIEMHIVVPADGPLVQRSRAWGVVPQVVPMPDAVLRAGESHLRGSRLNAWWEFGRRSVAAVPAAARYVRTLRSTLARIRADVVHSHGIKTHLAAAAAKPGGAVVWHAHDFFTGRPVTARLLRLAAARASGIVAVSDAVADDVRRLLPGRPVVTVPNAIDLTEFTPDAAPADLDNLAGLPPADGPTVHVGLVATYALWKGHDVFLDAAARLTARRPDLPLRFFAVGGPIYETRAQWSEQELRRRAGRHGLQSRVGFVPFQPDPASAYRALDVVVHASTLPEPFGLTIVEGMACGRAVVVSSGGGATELFTGGHDALGVPPGDAAALAGAIERLATDADLRRRLGGHARETAVRRFDRGRLGPQVLRAYDTIRGASGLNPEARRGPARAGDPPAAGRGLSCAD